MQEPELTRLGRYTIQSELGRGGHAVVYRAFDPSLERDVAVKVLHPALHSDPNFTQRFRREAKALAALRHPHVIIIYEVGEAEGRMFIVMELANGPSLDKHIAERGPLPWNEALEIMQQVCDALHYAHQQGIIHRDLKPSNILLDRDRGVLLSDFGLARLMGTSGASMSMSQGILGTPAYIAPEIWEMEVATPQADVYALGCILYEMLTGKTLFAGETPMQILRSHDKGPLFPTAWPAGMPGEVPAVLRKALARQPEERYTDVLSFRQSLEDAQSVSREEEERGQREAIAQQWRAEAESAVAQGEWSLAQMAVGRWLTVLPNDPAALAMRQEIDRRRSQVEQDRRAEEARARTAADAQRVREEKQRQTQAQNIQPVSPVRPGPDRKWIIALAAVGVLACLGIVLIGGNWLFDLFGESTVIANQQSETQTPEPTRTTPAVATPSRTALPAELKADEYAVAAGDSCWQIAQKYHVTVESIAALNGLPADCGPLTVGQVLRIPAPKATATAAPLPTATAGYDLLDPLDFMAYYYFLLAKDDCELAYQQITDYYRTSIGDDYAEYEQWCINVDQVEFLEGDVIQADGDGTAFVRIHLHWTFKNGSSTTTRPMRVGLKLDPTGKQWLVDTSVFTD